MATQPSELSLFFDPLPQPIVFVQDEIIAYQNPAAELLQLGKVGARLPGELLDLLARPELSSAVCTIAGQAWQFQCTHLPQGCLLFFQTDIQEELSQAARAASLLEQMRQHMGTLVATSHFLSPIIRQQEDKRYEQYLAIINQSFYRMMRLMNSADTAQAISDGTLSCHPGALDLATFCQALADELENLAELAGVEFSYESSTPSLLTNADSALLRQLLLALLSNAFQAAGSGGAAGLKLARSGGRALLTVWDNGPGLPSRPDAPSVPLRPRQGLGVGLPLARRIAALHGGTLILESGAGKGVRATLSLPITAPERSGAIRTPSVDRIGGFSPVLIEFADLLPWQAFLSENNE